MIPKRPFFSRRAKWLQEVHPAFLVAAGLLAIFVLILSINEPLPYQAAPSDENEPTTTTMVLTWTAEPTQINNQSSPTLELTQTATQLPEEYINNREQSIGIIAGTVVLVILVLGGTIAGIIARRRE